MELLMRKKDGETIWVSVGAKTQNDLEPDGTEFIDGTLEDVTEKKNVKEEGTDGETGDLTSREKMLLAQDAEKKGKKVLKGDVPDAVQKENCPFADEDSLEGDPLELDRIEDGDTEGRMAKKDLYKLAKYASELHNMIEDGEDLEGWVQAKIAKAADYIGAVFHFMDYDEASLTKLEKIKL